MNKKAISDAWTADQTDADNWLRIPEFEVNPQNVAFEGFAFPIVTPNTKGYWLRCIIREHVKTIRTLIRREGRSLSAVRASHIEFLDLMEHLPESGKIDADRNQAMSTYYMLAMYCAERAKDNSFGKNWRGTGPQTLEICLKEIAKCAEFGRLLMLMSLNSKTDLIDTDSLRESVMKDLLGTQKEQLSEAGTKGARTKHAGTNSLKYWATEKAKTMQGSDKQIASRLFSDLPNHLMHVSKDPKRFIYDVLRASKKL